MGEKYRDNAFLAVLGAALTPIPYKVFTIAGGLFQISLPTLIVASILGRGFRFFAVALVMYLFGERMEQFIKKYFNIFTVAFFALIVLGFIAIRYFF